MALGRRARLPLAIVRSIVPWRASRGRLESVVESFVRSLDAHGYLVQPLDTIVRSPEAGSVYIRHDINPGDLGIGLQLARVHERLKVPATFHLAWDLIEGSRRLRAKAELFCGFDRRYVQLGLQCDPISRWLAQTLFAGSEAELSAFVRSSGFAAHLGEMYASWQAGRGSATALRSLHDGSWQCLVALDRSFREVFGDTSSISGSGSLLSNAFSRARQADPRLAVLTDWFSPIDFLVANDVKELGYRFEATRFLPGGGPGPVVVFGGDEAAELREALALRIGGGGGLVTIFPAEYWRSDRYVDLLSPPGAPTTDAPGPAAALPGRDAMPATPFLTRETHLVGFGRDFPRLNKQRLADASRHLVGSATDVSFSRFVEWLRSEDYVFDGFENGPLRFADRRVYLRYDVHVQDLLAAYVLADLHERLGVVGSFQILWRFSRYEEAIEPYFVKLLDFDPRFVGFGLHAAPAASWYSYEKLNGDFSRHADAVSSEDFREWLLELHAAYERDGEGASALREIRAGVDDTFSSIAASFRATFGAWKSVSGHGNFLTNAFSDVAVQCPKVDVLRPYFHPVEYFDKWGVERFGFDYELTSLGKDLVPYPRVLLEGSSETARRRMYRGRVKHGAGFVAMFHPATWTCGQNATFFLPEESLEGEKGSASPTSGTPGDC